MRASPTVKDMAGQRFGKLLVLSYAGASPHGQSLWRCACDCGQSTTVIRGSLVAGSTKSCGCSHTRVGGDARNKNGNKPAPEYGAWAAMKTRCTNPNSNRWHDYGGRGISVCDEWSEDYLAFLNHVGRKPSPAHSLDRIDNDGNYEPGNVRWATRKQQLANRREFQLRSWRTAAKHAYHVVKMFEQVLASYTGAPHVVALDSCTNALLLACEYFGVDEVEIPKFTYCSVPMSIIHAGGRVKFRDEDWLGMYRLEPYPIYDSARAFTSGMYIPGSFMCLSFHWSKHLAIGRGGAILCDDENAVEWFKRGRFDGRKEGVAPRNDKGLTLGHHFYLTPPYAAQGLMLMASMAEHNDPLPNDEYADLSQVEIFK